MTLDTALRRGAAPVVSLLRFTSLALAGTPPDEWKKLDRRFDVRLDGFTGSATVNTSYGDVTGDLDASAGGDLRVRLADPGAASLSTADGDIVVEAPRGLSADLYLRGDDVHVASAFGLHGSVGRDRAEGRLGTGGPRLKARASDGSVTLREK